ncbi:VOC family protein [Rossellomorea vietnamensis]|uniref:VOC family protein n=1 Tax=Rossellomorea vietnamensis TaxID=218284 RepID=A0A5D4NYG5_9BACI|nr:VOC family protein [Rossellomorea vietnamensis]TYS18578.1 VOC family protein [Rossellomorea vietnamensis]
MFKVGSVFVPVTDLKKSASWYEENLGVKKIDEWEGGAGFYFPSGSTQLGLVETTAPQPTEFAIHGKKKNVYFNFVVEDINDVHQQLQSRGVVTTHIEDFGGMKCFDFYDPDGNIFSVVDEAEGSPFHSANIRRLQANDIE